MPKIIHGYIELRLVTYLYVFNLVAFIDIMKVVRFLLNGLHGIHDPKTFTNGITTLEVKTTTYV
jgi:hypothetical protein